MSRIICFIIMRFLTDFCYCFSTLRHIGHRFAFLGRLDHFWLSFAAVQVCLSLPTLLLPKRFVPSNCGVRYLYSFLLSNFFGLVYLLASFYSISSLKLSSYLFVGRLLDLLSFGFIFRVVLGMELLSSIYHLRLRYWNNFHFIFHMVV